MKAVDWSDQIGGEKMKGYKGMTKDMTCRGMQYEIGKSYHEDGPVEVCRKGLHFCRNLRDVLDYYGNVDGNRFFEVEVRGETHFRGDKGATTDIEIIRELSPYEVNRAYYGNGDGDGDGYGYGDGDGDGSGDGYGYGNGYGNGNGYGYGYGNKNIQRIMNFV